MSLKLLPSVFKATDELSPFDALLKDKQFWREYEATLIDEAMPFFLSSAIAGARVGARLRPRKVEKAYPQPTDVELTPARLNAIAEGAIRDYVPDWAKGIRDTTYKGVQDAVLSARANGTGVAGVMRDIGPLFGAKRSEAIAITETTRLMGHGAIATYKARGINGWEWMTVEDKRVEDLCVANQGKIFPIDKPFEPAHVRCRCFPAPALIDEPLPRGTPNYQETDNRNYTTLTLEIIS